MLAHAVPSYLRLDLPQPARRFRFCPTSNRHLSQVLGKPALRRDTRRYVPPQTSARETRKHRMSTAQPNILIIMVDQLVPMLMGTYGHPVVKTPNIDRLAARGVRFASAYSPCPVCSPARAAFMTGKYVSTTGNYDNATVLPADEPTVAHYLTNAGYDTVLSGKMHFVGPDQLHGFRTRLTTDVYPSDFGWTPVRNAEGDFVRGGHVRSYIAENVGVRAWNQFLAYDEETHFRALEYINARGRTDRAGESQPPFYLVASYHHPHEPFQPTQEYWDLYEGAEIDIPHWPENLDETYSQMDRWLNAVHATDDPRLADPEGLRKLRRSYYALVTYIDRKVGELMEALERTGQAEQTIVVFTSDHGDMLGERRMVQKRCFYEWSARIPLIVAYPDGRHAGTVVDQPVSLFDLTPTALDWAGVPEEDRLPMDAESLVPLIEGNDQARTVISEFHADKVKAPCFMVRRGPYKYVYIHGYAPQLFNLQEDPDEWHNLAGDPALAEVEQELRQVILERFDPDAIADAVLESVARRRLIQAAMIRADTHWDYAPQFDATKQYARRS